MSWVQIPIKDDGTFRRLVRECAKRDRYDHGQEWLRWAISRAHADPSRLTDSERPWPRNVQFTARLRTKHAEMLRELCERLGCRQGDMLWRIVASECGTEVVR